MSVDPKIFAKEMAKRWSDVLGNVVSGSLIDAWASMATVFNDHLRGDNTMPITALALPTGAGKTQGLSLYCALLSYNSPNSGVLVVTAFKSAADELAEIINSIAGSVIALAEHGDSKHTEDEINEAQVLIITHSAYQRSVRAELDNEYYKSKWSRHTQWRYGARDLTVIDESIDIVDTYDVSLEELRLICSLIPESLDGDDLLAADAIRGALSCLSQIRDADEHAPYELITFPDLKGAVAAFPSFLGKIKAHINTHFSKDGLNNGLSVCCERVLGNLGFILSSWSLYENSGAHHKLVTGRFVFEFGLNGGVVLDATSPEHSVTRFLEQKGSWRIVNLLDVKSYENLTIHISTGHKVGKGSLSGVPKASWQELLHDVDRNELSVSNAPLLCVHKEVEEKLVKAKVLPSGWRVMHWGNINGLNEWKDCDSVVVYGLPYLKHITAAVTLMSFLDWSYCKDDKVYGADVLKIDRSYIEEAYGWRHIIVSLVQAINRAHCRKIIEGGLCPKTDVFLFVNSVTDKERLVKFLRKLMPDVRFKDWNARKFDMDVKGLTKNEGLVVAGLDAVTTDYVRVDTLLGDCGVNKNTFINNSASGLTRRSGVLYDAVTQMGWRYVSAQEAKRLWGVYKTHFVREGFTGKKST